MIRFHEALEPLMEPAIGLHPNPDNPNNGDVDAIIASILTNGVYRPIIAAADGTIIAGHHLYDALLELGAVMVPVIRINTDSSGQRRIMVGDNEIARLARTDEALLLGVLKVIASEEQGLAGTGVQMRYYENLLEREAKDATTALHVDLHEESHRVTCPNCGHQWKVGA